MSRLGGQIWIAISKLLFGKEVTIMAEVYATLIIKGVKTFAQVPRVLKAKVKEVLDALDLSELAAEE